MTTALLIFLLQFQAGASLQDVQETLGPERDCSFEQRSQRLACRMAVRPFDGCTFVFLGGKLYSIKFTKTRKGTWPVLKALYAELIEATEGLKLEEAGGRPLSLAGARSRLEGKGTARTSAAVMASVKHPRGEAMAKLHAFKTKAGAQAYGLQLTWLPARPKRVPGAPPTGQPAGRSNH